jgi:hypothetical protein
MRVSRCIGLNIEKNIANAAMLNPVKDGIVAMPSSDQRTSLPENATSTASMAEIQK